MTAKSQTRSNSNPTEKSKNSSLNPIPGQGTKTPGGLNTNRPPSNVKPAILASNFDALTISVYIDWEDSIYLKNLEVKKQLAVDQGEPYSMRVPIFGNNQRMEIQPHGVAGFTYMLVGNELSVKMGKWLKMLNRPNAMITVRSETLWRMGTDKIIKYIERFLISEGAKKIKMKISRVDMCVDVLVPEENWNIGLVPQGVSRATTNAVYYTHRNLSGLTWGKGDLMIRMYDKPLEITTKSKKSWMFKVWNLKEVPAGFRIIRIEFQIRREIFKELKIDTVSDLLEKYRNLWAYLTRDWFQLKDNPGKHQTNQRKVTELWRVVQEGFTDQKVEPLIRSKAIKVDEKQLYQQAYGMMSSLNALRATINNRNDVSSFGDTIKYLQRINMAYDNDYKEFAKRSEKKRSKFHRALALN